MNSFQMERIIFLQKYNVSIKKEGLKKKKERKKELALMSSKLTKGAEISLISVLTKPHLRQRIPISSSNLYSCWQISPELFMIPVDPPASDP